MIYRFLWRLGAVVSRLFFRIRVVGSDKIPASGGFVLAPVHRSALDFVFAAMVTKRPIHFMAKDSIWKVKPAGWLLDRAGSFPVRRGAADRRALEQCERWLERGEPVAIFPEGTRRFGPTVTDVFDGAAFVAARAHVPLVPVGIGGSEAAMPKGAKLPRRVRVTVVVGDPIDSSAAWSEGRLGVDRKAVKALTSQVTAAVQHNFDAATALVGTTVEAT